MKIKILLVFLVMFSVNSTSHANESLNVFNFSFEDIDGNQVDLKKFTGKPILVVNTASRCGFTPQYENLQNLFLEYKNSDLTIIATTSNSFSQEFQNVEDIKKIGSTIEKNVICMQILNPIQIYGKLYRAIGAYYFVSNNQEKAKRWFLVAQETDPGFNYGMTNISPEMVSFFNALREEAIAEPEVLEDKTLNLPEGTKLYVDGRLMERPEITKGRPHIAFLVSTATEQIQARYIYEDEFPESLLKDRSNEEVVEMGIINVQRIRPPSKTPLMVVGGLSALTAVGIYGYTFKTNQDFENALTEEDMRSIQSLNNGLVITAGVVGIVGVVG